MFAVALDMSTHMSNSYLDSRIRLHLNKLRIINVHLLEVTVYDRHTGQVMFDIAVKSLHVLCSSWKEEFIGVSTYGERERNFRISGIATCFQQAAKPGFI